MAVNLLQQPVLNRIVEVMIGVEDEAYELDAVPWGYRTFQLVKDSVREVREGIHAELSRHFMYADHEEEVVSFVGRCLVGGVFSELVHCVDVRSILQVLFDDPHAGHAVAVELQLGATANKIVRGLEESGQSW